MEGECVLFKAFGSSKRCSPCCMRSQNVNIVRSFVTLEDIGRLLRDEAQLKECCDMPVHDEPHRTQ